MDVHAITWEAGMGLWCGFTLAVLGVALVLIHRRVGWGGGIRRLFRGCERGTATIEFALVFPILLVLILLLAQVTLLMVGNLYVHYAAFAATRAAIVQIPRETANEPINMIWPSEPGLDKYQAIHRAAIFALVPVSGRVSDGNGSAGDVSPAAYVDALRDHFDQGQGDRPAWVDTLAEDKVRYAASNTDITLLVYDENDQDGGFEALQGVHTFGPRDPVTVRVEHRFNLAVPYVRFFFADGRYDTDDGEGAYAIIEAQTTLTNQGVPPEMPEPPAIRRIP